MPRKAFSLGLGLFLASTVAFLLFFRTSVAPLLRNPSWLEKYESPPGPSTKPAGPGESLTTPEDTKPTTPSFPQDTLYDVLNSTIGVQKVFLISLPNRRHKRDAFAVQAHLTNITYSVRKGIFSDDFSKEELPYTMDMTPPEIGCWRAHMNIFSEMLERNIATAAVFEDDADWDVSIKQQLLRFARGSRYITGVPPNATSLSPYGQDWDILFLGHCSSKTWPHDRRRFLIPHDPTVIPPSARREIEQPDMRYWEQSPPFDIQTRVVFRNRWSACTAAYIISAQGGAKALHHMSMASLPFLRKPVATMTRILQDDLHREMFSSCLGRVNLQCPGVSTLHCPSPNISEPF